MQALELVDLYAERLQVLDSLLRLFPIAALPIGSVDEAVHADASSQRLLELVVEVPSPMSQGSPRFPRAL